MIFYKGILVIGRRPSGTQIRCNVRPALRKIIAFLCFVSCNIAFAEGDDTSAAAQVPDDAEAISIPVPEGQDVMGIRIPHHNMNGELVMLITAEIARRVEDGEIEMERMKIDLWDDDRAHSWLAMPKSRFNMGTRVLSGNNGALIERDDFTIEGENLEFDLASQKGIMRGKVTMTIKQVEQLTQ